MALRLEPAGRGHFGSWQAALGCSGGVHFQNFHWVLNRTVWPARECSRVLLGLLVQTFAPRGAPVFGLDETIERRWGRHIKARSIYRDAARSSKSVTNKAIGLCWLSVQLLAYVPWTQRLWAPFFDGAGPFASLLPKERPHTKNLTDCARQVIAHVHRWLPRWALIFVGDMTCAALELLAFPAPGRNPHHAATPGRGSLRPSSGPHRQTGAAP